LRSLLTAVARGEINPETALDKLKHLAFEPVEDFAKIDHHRQLRTGFPEVIWGPGKTTAQIAQIIDVLRQNSPVVMATRIEAEIAAQLQEQVTDYRHLLDAADVLIVVAGMEGALPSVVAGLVDRPVIAVPTSIGYGTSFGGIAPLLTMLNSCAVGVGVVNIDNGFGAAMLAGQILRTAARLA